MFKGYAIAPEPLLMLFGLIFAHMIRECERKLAESPLYKKKQAEMKSKGETGANFNVVRKRSSLESDDLDDPANNNTMATKNLTKNQPHSLRGIDNVGLNIDDEVNATPLDPGVRDKHESPTTVAQKDCEAISIEDAKEGS